jgi:hypothetical protein
MRKKISTTIYVTPEQSDKLKLLHERTKVPVAVYIREGIDLVLRHYQHMLPGQLPLVDTGERAPERAAEQTFLPAPSPSPSPSQRRDRDSRQDLSAVDDKPSKPR